MRKAPWVLLLAVWILTGCDAGDANKSGQNTPDDSDGPGGGEAWLLRKPTPESVFAPTNFEKIIDELVDDLNKTDQAFEMKLTFLPKTLDGFFEMSVLGANRAFAELGVLNTVVAPVSDLEEGVVGEDVQAELIDEQITGGATGVGIAPINNDVLNPHIDAAVDAGATVITFDTDAADTKRHLYIGTNNAQAGVTGGETMVRLLGDAVGTVVILGNDDEAWTDGYNRTHEARKVIEAAGNTVVVIHVRWSDREANIGEMQEVMETADSTVGCLGVFANSFLCVDAAMAAGMENDIQIVAFDSEPQTLSYLEQGYVKATHVQRVYYMGYLLPYLLYAINTLGLEETQTLVSDLMVDDQRIDTGLDVIESDQLDAYNAFMDELGVLL